MFKKKIGIYALTFAMAAMGMTGCSSGSSSSSKTEVTTQAANKASSEPFSVVCTIFPEYDWVREILGDHADIGCQCVINPGTVIGCRTTVYPLTSLRGVIPEDCIVKSMQNIIIRKDN